MLEFKKLDFTIIGGNGKVHKISYDKLECEAPTVDIHGDVELLKRRWNMVKETIETKLFGSDQ